MMLGKDSLTRSGFDCDDDQAADAASGEVWGSTGKPTLRTLSVAAAAA